MVPAKSFGLLSSLLLGPISVCISISEPFIRRPVGTTLLSIGLFLVGLVAYVFLPVAPVPNVDFPSIRVQATRPGADPP